MKKENKCKGKNCQCKECKCEAVKELTEEEIKAKEIKTYEMQCEIGFWFAVLCWILPLMTGHFIGTFTSVLISLFAIQGLGTKKHIKAVVGLVLAAGLLIAAIIIVTYNNAMLP